MRRTKVRGEYSGMDEILGRESLEEMVQGMRERVGKVRGNGEVVRAARRLVREAGARGVVVEVGGRQRMKTRVDNRAVGHAWWGFQSGMG